MDAIWQEISAGVTKVFSIDTSAPVEPNDCDSAKSTVLITKQDYIRLYTIIYDSCNKRTSGKPAVTVITSNSAEPGKYIYEHLQTFIIEYITSLAAKTQIQTSDISLINSGRIITYHRLSQVTYSIILTEFG